MCVATLLVIMCTQSKCLWTKQQMYYDFHTIEFSCFCSVIKTCLTLCDPMNCRMLGFPVLHYFTEFAQIHVNWVSDAIQHLILCCPLLLLPLIFPSIRVFSSESALCIRWPANWSFSFSTSTFNEYSGLIFFRIDWFDFLAVHGILNSLLGTIESISSLALSLLYSSTLTSLHDY